MKETRSKSKVGTVCDHCTIEIFDCIFNVKNYQIIDNILSYVW